MCVCILLWFMNNICTLNNTVLGWADSLCTGKEILDNSCFASDAYNYFIYKQAMEKNFNKHAEAFLLLVQKPDVRYTASKIFQRNVQHALICINLKRQKNFLRAGFEPATYGCLSITVYSPPLYQLSYQRRYETW